MILIPCCILTRPRFIGHTDFLKGKEKAFPGKGNPRDEEMMRLKKEYANMKLERDILKKALAVFSRDEK